jgi:hypothetical protein
MGRQGGWAREKDERSKHKNVNRFAGSIVMELRLKYIELAIPGNTIQVTGCRGIQNTVAGCWLPVAGKYKYRLQVTGEYKIQLPVAGFQLPGNTNTGYRLHGKYKYSCRLPVSSCRGIQIQVTDCRLQVAGYTLHGIQSWRFQKYNQLFRL